MLKHRNILQFYSFFANDRCKIKDKIKLRLRFVHSRNINSTVLVFPLRSELFYFIQFHQAGNCFTPDRQFRCRIRIKSGNFRELLIDHSCKVHYIVFIWKLLYEVCLVQIKEEMNDNPLNIPFQMSRDLTTYHK